MPVQLPGWILGGAEDRRYEEDTPVGNIVHHPVEHPGVSERLPTRGTGEMQDIVSRGRREVQSYRPVSAAVRRPQRQQARRRAAGVG